MHLKSQQYVQYINHVVDLLYHKREVSQKVFYFTPDVSCSWIKTGVYKVYKSKNMVCYLDQLPPIGL